MVDVSEALQLILSTARSFGTRSLPLDGAMGKVIREELFADRPMPPFDRVTMDGIAIRFSDWESGIREYQIAGIAAAGKPKMNCPETGKCLEVMTGAILPDGLDTVIRYEETEIENGVASILAEYVDRGQNIHYRGSDRPEGDLLVKTGTVISAAEIAIASSIGKSEVLVSLEPKVLVISTGDELVDIDRQPLEYQVRKSNVHMLAAHLAKLGISSDLVHFEDDYGTILRELQSSIQRYDCILLSGGVSKGKYDHVPAVLEELGVKKLFHRVSQRPGKPFWFGHKGACCIFAFPGNPVSTFACFCRYFLPWLEESIGKTSIQINARLAEDVDFKPDLTYFPQVRIEFGPEGVLFAYPEQGNGSGDYANMTRSDGFLELPRGKERFNAGESYRFIPFREF